METKIGGFGHWIKNIWESVCRLAESIFVTTIIPVVVIVLDLLGFFSGTPILSSAVIAGVILCISIFFVIVGMPTSARAKTIRFIGKFGFWIDLVFTVVLTIWGFKMGATLGLICMLMGLNISALTALIRLACLLVDEDLRANFLGERLTQKAKRMTKPAGSRIEYLGTCVPELVLV